MKGMGLQRREREREAGGAEGKPEEAGLPSTKEASTWRDRKVSQLHVTQRGWHLEAQGGRPEKVWGGKASLQTAS